MFAEGVNNKCCSLVPAPRSSGIWPPGAQLSPCAAESLGWGCSLVGLPRQGAAWGREGRALTVAQVAALAAAVSLGGNWPRNRPPTARAFLPAPAPTVLPTAALLGPPGCPLGPGGGSGRSKGEESGWRVPTGGYQGCITWAGGPWPEQGSVWRSPGHPGLWPGKEARPWDSGGTGEQVTRATGCVTFFLGSLLCLLVPAASSGLPTGPSAPALRRPPCLE